MTTATEYTAKAVTLQSLAIERCDAGTFSFRSSSNDYQETTQGQGQAASSRPPEPAPTARFPESGKDRDSDMRNQIPSNLRRWQERAAATRVADMLLRTDRRRQRAQAMPKLTKKAPKIITAGPQPLRLPELKRAFAARERLQRRRV